MKKTILLAFFCAALTAGFSASAEDDSAKPYDFSMPTYNTWTIFQLGLFPGVPSYTQNSWVVGMKTGWPMCSGKGLVDGFESSWLYSGTEHVQGLQASLLIDYAKFLRGFQPAVVVSICSGSLEGVQASCVFNLAGNVLGMQAGGLNIAKRIDGFQPGVLGSISNQVNGCQAGLYCVAEELAGAQVSVVNVAKDAEHGVQVGLLNVACRGKGFQIGLINIIKDGDVPFLPFFNISD